MVTKQFDSLILSIDSAKSELLIDCNKTKQIFHIYTTATSTTVFFCTFLIIPENRLKWSHYFHYFTSTKTNTDSSETTVQILADKLNILIQIIYEGLKNKTKVMTWFVCGAVTSRLEGLQDRTQPEPKTDSKTSSGD